MKKFVLLMVSFALLLGGCAREAKTASVQVESPSPEETELPVLVEALEEDELASFEALFAVMLQVEGEMQINPLNCFLTSCYDSAAELDMQAFLRYFPGSEYGSEAEFEALRKLPGWPFADLADINDMPVPLSRYDAESVRQALWTYARLTLEDVDISPESRVYYLEDYDAFYNYTSDFGLEQPDFYRGERQGDTVRLYWQHWYEGERELSLRETESGIQVLSHRLIKDAETE